MDFLNDLEYAREVTRIVIEKVAAELEARAEQEARGSKDFGRGYKHAIKVLRDMRAV